MPQDVGGIGQLERVSYTPHTESFLSYIPLLCYCLVLPAYYAFRKQKILATILIGLCLILSLQMPADCASRRWRHVGSNSNASMNLTQPTPAASDQKERSRAAEWVARTKAKLALYKVARGRFTRRDTVFDVQRGECAIGFWLRERDHWRLHKLVVSDAFYFELQIDEEVQFARLTRTTFHSTKVILYFDKVMRITIGIRELNVSCQRADVIRSDWAVKSWIFPFKSNPSVPTT
jgi:hypothetical protein